MDTQCSVARRWEDLVTDAFVDLADMVGVAQDSLPALADELAEDIDRVELVLRIVAQHLDSLNDAREDQAVDEGESEWS